MHLAAEVQPAVGACRRRVVAALEPVYGLALAFTVLGEVPDASEAPDKLAGEIVLSPPSAAAGAPSIFPIHINRKKSATTSQILVKARKS